MRKKSSQSVKPPTIPGGAKKKKSRKSQSNDCGDVKVLKMKRSQSGNRRENVNDGLTNYERLLRHREKRNEKKASKANKTNDAVLAIEYQPTNTQTD